MALVDEHQRVVGQVFEQGRRRLAGFAAGEIARIVLDAGAAAGRLHHFQVEERALLQPLRFEQPAGGVELVEPLPQLDLDAGDRLQQRRPRRHVVRVGVDLHEFELVGLLPGERIEFVDRLQPRRRTATRARRDPRSGPEKSRWRRRARGTSRDRNRRPMRLYCSATRSASSCALVDALAALERERHRRIGLDRADAVDARHRSDDDHVVALEQRARRRVAHAVDLLVDRGFLLDIGVGARDVGFRLVVVVVGDEILDRVVGKEGPELAVELRRQRLVGREDQRRALRLLDHLRHGEGLARAGDAEQHLGAVVALHALDQLGDRLRLVALGLEIGLDDEARGRLPTSPAAAAGAASTGRIEKLRPAFAQQPVERLLAGETGNGRNLAAARPPQAQVRRPHVRSYHAALCVAFGVSFLLIDTQRAGEVRIELARRHRRLADIALLRRLAKAARHRGARPVRVGEIGAAIPRIVGRRRELRWLLFPAALRSSPTRSLFPSPLWGGARGGGREATLWF